jgi:hypothetical protein
MLDRAGALSFAEEEPVGALVLASPSIRLALLYGLAQRSAKICADREVLAQKDSAEDVVGHEPVRDSTFVRGCVA